MTGIRSLLKKPILLFTISRYAGYALMLVRGLLVAKLLGPYLFGVWGFLTLAQQYLSYTSLGLQHAVTVELATESVSAAEKQAELIGSALSITALISAGLILLGFGIQASGVPLFEKYSFSQYVLVLGIIVGLSHLQQLFTNIYRVYGKLARIAASELLSTTLPLMAVLIFKDAVLIEALLGSLVLSGLLSIVLFVVRAPFKVAFKFSLHNWRRLVAMGMPLLVYTASFYFITVSGRTIVSAFYSVETMGYYSLANTITTGTLLGLNAVSWVVYPNILSRTHAGISDHLVAEVVRKVNDLYGTSVFLAVFGVILGLPVLFFFLPQYQPAANALSVLLLSQAVLAVSFGYNCVAIARRKHMKVAGIGVIAGIVVTGLSLLVALLKMSLTWIAVAVLVGAFVYTLWQARLGAAMIEEDHMGIGYVKSVLPWGSLTATLIFIAGILAGYPTPAGLVGVAIFVVANRQKIEQLWKFARDRSMQAPPGYDLPPS